MHPCSETRGAASVAQASARLHVTVEASVLVLGLPWSSDGDVGANHPSRGPVCGARQPRRQAALRRPPQQLQQAHQTRQQQHRHGPRQARPQAQSADRPGECLLIRLVDNISILTLSLT